jgi:hypothetical protein
MFLQRIGAGQKKGHKRFDKVTYGQKERFGLLATA